MTNAKAPQQTPAKRKARQLVRHLRGERPDHAYLKEVFRHLRAELGIEVNRAPKKLPYVPTEDEIRRYYRTVWAARRGSDIVLIKTLLYTGVRVSELVRIRLSDVDLNACRIRITQGKGGKDRGRPFPRFVQRDPCPTHRGSAAQAGSFSLRIELEEAVHRSRRPQDPGSLQPGRRDPPTR
jgi:integrase